MAGLESPNTVAAGTPVLIPTGLFQDQPPVALNKLCAIIGAKEGADLQLAFGGVSDIHAIIVTTPGGVYVRGFAGPGGMFVNGSPAFEQFLNDGDELQVGQFIFKFSANHAQFGRSLPPPDVAVEINGTDTHPLQGRTALIGSQINSDIQLDDSAVSEAHAVIFTAGATWNIRDLGSDNGTFYNGQGILQAPLRGDEVVTVGKTELRLRSAAAAMPAFAMTATFIGGMPVELPEVRVPEGFGKVGVSFGGKSFAAHLAAAAAPAPPAIHPPAAATAQPAPPVEVPQAAPRRLARLPGRRPKPLVTAEQEAARQAEEAAQAQAEALFALPPNDVFSHGFAGSGAAAIQDAVFGGADEPLTVDPSEFAESLSAEVEDFSVSEFWDQPDHDGADVPLPSREKDLAPPIPSAQASHAPTVSRIDRPLPVPHRTALASLSEGNGNAAKPPPPRTSRRRAGKRRAGVLAVTAILCAAVAGGAVWLAMPEHSTVQDHLRFLHAPLTDAAALAAFQTDQKSRLADSSLRQIAATKLHGDHPSTDLGILSPSSQAYDAVIQTARFQNADPDSIDLVLQIRSADAAADGERLTAILKALYDKDADLVGAAATARQALEDWKPGVAAMQTALDQLHQRIDEQQSLITQAKTAAAGLAPLLAQAKQAGQKYVTLELSAEKDQETLAALNVPAGAATQPAPTNNLTGAGGQIEQLTEQLQSLQSVSSADPNARLDQNRLAAERRMDQELKSAQNLFGDQPGLLEEMIAAGELQNRVRDLVNELVQRRRNIRGQLEDFRRQVDRGSRLRQEILTYDNKSLAPGEHRRPIIADESAHLSNRLGRLIEAARLQLTEERKLVDVTLQTLSARLGAVSVPSGLNSAGQAQLERVTQAADDLAQAENAYATAVSQSDPTEQSIAALQERLDELNARSAARRQVLDLRKAAAATRPVAYAPQLSPSELASRLSDEEAEIESAHRQFADAATAAVDAASKVQAGREAAQVLGGLVEARDAKAGDLGAANRGRDDLDRAVNIAVIPKRPSESDVQVLYDNDPRRTAYATAAALFVAGAFGLIMKKKSPRTASAPSK